VFKSTPNLVNRVEDKAKSPPDEFKDKKERVDGAGKNNMEAPGKNGPYETGQSAKNADSPLGSVNLGDLESSITQTRPS
jgi:hypothetical protein